MAIPNWSVTSENLCSTSVPLSVCLSVPIQLSISLARGHGKDKELSGEGASNLKWGVFAWQKSLLKRSSEEKKAFFTEHNNNSNDVGVRANKRSTVFDTILLLIALSKKKKSWLKKANKMLEGFFVPPFSPLFFFR